MTDSEDVRIVRENADQIPEATDPAFDPYELLNDAFMQEHTSLANLGDLLARSGILDRVTRLDDLYSDPVNEVVAANSGFPDVQEMLKQAGAEQIARQIKQQPGS